MPIDQDRPTFEYEAGGELAIVVSSSGGMWRKTLKESARIVVGRAPGCDIVIEDDSVSRRHAVLEIGEQVRISDLGSRNGTRVLGRRLASGESVSVPVGSVAELGATTVVVLRGSSSLRDGQVVPTTASAPLDTGPVVADPTMQRLYGLVELIAPSSLSVLVLGETGTGKEVFARRLHERSKRADKPLLAINCASLQEALLESDLFGHEKGAFTGATSAKQGLLESAEGGTVFLDEIAELSLATQAKLLRVLQDGEVMRVGGLRPKRVDVRVVSATNRDLLGRVSDGTFRADLFYRINGFVVTLPPLRARRGDVLPLATHYVRLAAGSRRVPRFTQAAEQALLAYDFPGNVRELRTLVERALVLAADRDTIDTADLMLPATSRPPVPPAEAAPALRPEAPSAVPAPGERERILEALAQTHGNQKAAAKLVGVSRQTFVNRLKQYGIGRPRKSTT